MTMSSGTFSRYWMIEEATKITLAWVDIAPFGSPVLPEV
jgi:hypothetical protein